MIKIIHQTWKNKNIPELVYPKHWLDSWRKLYPTWEYKLWTDEDNRNLIKEYYPKYLEVYDSFPQNIKRVDYVRSFILHRYGGLYADLDCIALKPLDELIKDNKIVLASEPNTTWHQNKGKLFLSNALMYSIPNHSFWEETFEEVKNIRFKNQCAVMETGPGLITRTYEKLKNVDLILDQDTFIWSCSGEVKDVKRMSFTNNKSLDKGYVIHATTTLWENNVNKDIKNNLSYVYTLIADNKIPSRIQMILDHNKAKCENLGINFKVIPFTVEAGECAAGKSDWLRIKKASEEPRILYVDWDCKIVSFPNIFPDYPMMAKINEQQYDLWAFYNGDKTDLFKNLYNRLRGKMGGLESYFSLINNKEFNKNFVPIVEFSHIGIQCGRAFKPKENN